jgi:hypothetical protein
MQEGKLLIEQALALDPTNAQAYIERGYMRAFGDLVKTVWQGRMINRSTA